MNDDQNWTELNHSLVFLFFFIIFSTSFSLPGAEHESGASLLLAQNRLALLLLLQLLHLLDFRCCLFTDMYVCTCAQCCWVCRTRRWARGPFRPAWSDGWPCCLAKRWDWSDVSSGLHPLATAVFRYCCLLL